MRYSPTPSVSRRQWLRRTGALAGVAAAQVALPQWMPRLAFAPPYENPKGDVLLVVFLRGGADALNMVVPHGDDDYYAARPQLAIPRPDSAETQKVLDLDGFFGLHPALAPLLPRFQAGGMTAIHATGSPQDTRSHFEAMGYMERGITGSTHVTGGWVARHLMSLESNNTSPLRGIGWGTAVQQALAGAPSVVAMKSIIDYHLAGDEQIAAQMVASLTSLYALDNTPVETSATNTRSAIELVQQVGYDRYGPQHGAVYPESEFALALRQTAALVRAEVGLEVACVDLGGWDTHAQQGGAEGEQAQLLNDLATGLAAFGQDMGDLMGRITVVVMSEFGRRVAENANVGTDHGHGGAMLVMSDNLAPSPVVATWPGLHPDVLAHGEDLAITTDYRDILTEILRQRLKNDAIASVFPSFTAKGMGLFR